MIWRQVKQRMARVKLILFFFHLKFAKMKKFVYHFSPQTTELIRKYLSSIQKIIDKGSFA